MRGIKHFFPVPPIQTNALTIRGIGVQERMPPCLIDRPHGTGDYMLMYFYDEVLVGAGGAPVLQLPETLVLWTPGHTQTYGHATQPFNHTWMHCHGTFIRGLLQRLRLPLNAPLRVSDPSIIERHLLAIHAELTGYAAPDERIVRNLLENWLRETVRAWAGHGRTLAVPPAYLALRHRIESTYDEPWTLARMAAQVHHSVPHCRAQFRQYFGTPPVDYLIRQRLHRAAYLLQDRNLSISEVAARVGYADLFHFSKLFKRHYGVSPRHFRQAGGAAAG